MDEIKQKALDEHKKLRGKIEVTLKDKLDDLEKLKLYYTPGVGAVSTYVAENPSEAREYTWLNNSVAVISDGSAVLGLGNIGPLGALPVMEGKCMLFKQFANIDAVPIVLDVHSADEIVSAVKAIAPSFGAINLEDISAPICFEVEQRLKDELNIPIMHDDQHGTAVVVLAGLINAMKVVGKNLSDCKIVLVGAGAAGVAIAKLLYKYAQPQIIAVDSKGIIETTRDNLNTEKKLLLEFSDDIQPGCLEDAIKDADIFIGVSQPGLLTQDMVKTMAKDPIIFALANPVPEIYPNEAKAAGAAVVATGRSDFPNQVNNALAFPGIFRGALDNQVEKITDGHKIKAAETIAGFIKNPTKDEIIPSIFEADLTNSISKNIT
ncbi:NADP-dependent malic enzyme [Candidatus Nomurabacteria bacterium]|nr:NADP-dependent malic enzyme [Candidatus Saccharibacteria bacterium]MCB9821810.1 NADP-dependent malic enzyme [Candidatus Nomurabacteria bacterium]